MTISLAAYAHRLRLPNLADAMLIARHVAIVGGGFSGTLLAINLLRNGAQRVMLIERQASHLARGLAFGAAGEGHVLNVRAANMSAFPDEPDHFADWLTLRDEGSAQESFATRFATRRDYGAYLAGLLDAARRASAERLSLLNDEAIDLDLAGERPRLSLASGAQVEADLVVLASGNLPPHDLPAFTGFAPPVYFGDPWAGDIAAGLGEDDTVLLLGSGLTAVDCALTLDNAGFAGRIVMLSRRGLAPRAHEPGTPYRPIAQRPGGLGADLLYTLRRRSEQVGWRNAVDELRPYTQDIWQSADPAARARFLRHARAFWDVHRHRLAPAVAQRLLHMQEQGRLSVAAGKIRRADPREGRLRVTWRTRGHDALVAIDAARVVNCTGPLGDLRRARDPLLRRLVDKGMIRPDALSIGIDVDRDGRAIGRDGAANERLFVVGPMTRGAHWEIVAVPDIRRQVWTLARYATAAYWVGGEGL